jgi:hypothetical protein
MLIISAGMQKSGSAYIYNLINDLIISSGNKDARKIKKNYKLEDIMQWHNNNIGELDFKVLSKLAYVSVKEGKLAVKTHDGPTKYHNTLVKLGLIKTIYIYRDPRDVLLSVQDHGRKIIKEGESHTFANMVKFDDAFWNVKKWINIYKSYKGVKGVFILGYEELINEPLKVINNICDYLNITVSEEDKNNILFKYNKDNPKANMKGLHYNKAVVKRYESELTKTENDLFKTNFGEVIIEMGYKI